MPLPWAFCRARASKGGGCAQGVSYGWKGAPGGRVPQGVGARTPRGGAHKGCPYGMLAQEVLSLVDEVAPGVL